MDRKLMPPLFTLLAFEAAGRLQSFTRAARELNMTQAAVSKQIKLLEAHLGTPLFIRANRAVHLTPEGREYLHTVVTALTHVSLATQELQPVEAGRRLVVAVDHSVGALWLVPRLPALLAALPEITFHVVVSDAEARCLAGEVDVAILHGEDRLPTHDAVRLFDEVVFPVCSPDYLRKAGPITTAADLAKVRLIDLEDENWTWINWRIWLTDHGVGLPATHRALTIGNYPLVLEAARRGAGVALAWQNLIEDDLAAGNLVRPLGEEVRTRFGYQLAWPRARPPGPHALAFMTWVKAEFGIAT